MATTSGRTPPLNEQEWLRVHELYQQSPEFTQKHHWMDLNDFKNIFFWEWFHRLWGRLIGLAFALPLAYFWIRGQIPQGYKAKLFGLLCLGSAQGLMGWVMVQSGLIDNPNVSHYRLAAHLLLAMLIIITLTWTALSIRNQKTTPLPSSYLEITTMIFLLITITWGAFTAGLDAGLIYNSYPLMNGHFIPLESASLLPS